MPYGNADQVLHCICMSNYLAEHTDNTVAPEGWLHIYWVVEYDVSR